MRNTLSMIGSGAPVDTELIASLIVQTQRPNGEIPWWSGGKTDPWDHVEAAMGLSIGGYLDQAKRAFDWMTENQLDDGSFYAAYRNGVPENFTCDTNMSAYIAVGVFHHFLITGSTDFLRKMWPTVRKALDFAVSHQAPGGEIFWAVDPDGNIDPMALLTGSSSIYMSIKCALAIADRLGRPMTGWQVALKKLGNAIRQKPGNFNATKSRYSMDWFYPVLCGAITGEKAQQRIDRFWKKFVIENKGARCVSDRPWVTVAETCELSVALSAMGRLDLAELVFNWIQDKANQDGSYWCGFTCPDMTIWPDEKTTWTNAVVLIAADAIYSLTPAGRLFNHRSWKNDKWLDVAAG